MTSNQRVNCSREQDKREGLLAMNRENGSESPRSRGMASSCLVIGLAIGTVLAWTPQALATNNCIQDKVNFNLQCTSNDVRVAGFNVLSGPTECVTGDDITVTLQAEEIAGASERYDIGLFVALDGGNALTGSCLQDYLPPPLEPHPPLCTGAPNPSSGTGPYYNAECHEDPADTCGDLAQGVTTLRNLSPITIKCQDSNHDGIADVNTCTSWDNQNSNGTTKPSCTTANQTLPGTPAKCNCEPVQVGNIVVRGQIIVDKITAPSGDPTSFNFTLTGGPASINVPFSLTDAAAPFASAPLAAGTYNVAESVPDGWTLASVTCSDGSPANAISLGPGEIVTCTFRDDHVCTVENCNDNNACTSDVCTDSNGNGILDTCTHTSIVCNDNSECTTDTCNPATGCVYTPVSCDDGNACTDDSCASATGCAHAPHNCDDNNACTDDSCVPATGCAYAPHNCNDNNACTDDTCVPATGCAYAPHNCNDSNPCTEDSCVPATGCVYTPVACNVCTIPGVTISNTPWNHFNIPPGTTPVVWLNAHMRTSGIPTTTTTTVLFTGGSFILNGASYALPDGLLTFDPAAPPTITTVFNAAANRWETLVNPSHLSDEIFFTGAAIPVTAAIAAGGTATWTFTVLSEVPDLSFSWQWSAAAYTYWPADWNQALIRPYHAGYHAGTPLNPAVQVSLIQGPRGGGGSNFTGSWSATGHGACP
jgi:hypothetical protein